MKVENQSMTPDERAMIYVLERLSWPVSTTMFNALLAATVSVPLEVVIFTEIPEGTRVFLLPRPDDDPFWSGKVHIPGTIMRPGDTEESALTRVLTKEISNHFPASRLIFVGRQHRLKGTGPMQCARGQEVSLLFYGVWNHTEPPREVILADPDNLPENIIDYHRVLIAQAMKQYKN